MPIETQTGQSKKKLIDAVKVDLGDVTKALGTARDIFRALTSDAKGLDLGLVTACTGWGTHLDKMMQDVEDEGAAVAKRMGANGRSEVTESVNEPHIKAVVAARDKRGEEKGLGELP